MARLVNRGAASGLKSAAAVDLYVSGLNGSDITGDGTSGNPYASIVMAESALPDIIAEPSHRAIIHVGDHGATPYTIPRFRDRLLSADVYVYGDGALQPGEDGFTAQAGVGSSGTADGASTTETLIFTAGGMTVDAFRGMWIQITSGAASGDVRIINGNSATAFTPARAFTASVAGSTYRIVRPTARITMPSGEHVLVEGGRIKNLQARSPAAGSLGSPVHHFINLGFDASTATATVGLVCQAPCNFFGIDSSYSTRRINVTVPGGTVGSTGGVNFASPSTNLIADGLITALSQWDGHGWGATAVGAMVELANSADIYHGFDPIGLAIVGVGWRFGIADAMITGGSFKRVTPAANSPLFMSGRCAIFGPSATLKVEVAAESIGITVGFGEDSNNRQQSLVLANVDVVCTGSGVGLGLLLNGNASLRTGHSITSDHVGIHARRGSALFDGAPSVSGTTADLSFDGATGLAASLLAGAGDIIDGHDVHFRRE